MKNVYISSNFYKNNSKIEDIYKAKINIKLNSTIEKNMIKKIT